MTHVLMLTLTLIMLTMECLICLITHIWRHTGFAKNHASGEVGGGAGGGASSESIDVASGESTDTAVHWLVYAESKAETRVDPLMLQEARKNLRRRMPELLQELQKKLEMS
jgi:hypothetical protein